MYVWLGASVDEQLSSHKQKAFEAAKVLGNNVWNVLPWHISLKISFEADGCFEEIVASVCDFYRKLSPVTLQVNELENAGNIVWIRYCENESLSKIKDGLNAMLKERFGVPLHEYDLDFIFHTTLTMDSLEQNQAFYLRMKDLPLPESVVLTKFLVGYSPSESPESYCVVKTVDVSDIFGV